MADGEEEPPFPEMAPLGVSELSEGELDRQVALKQAGVELLEAGDFLEALGSFSEAIALGCASALLYSRRAQSLLRLGRPRAACNDCTAALSINPDSGKAYKIRARAYRRLERWEEAHSDFQTGLTIDYDEGTYEESLDVAERAKEIRDAAVAKRLQQERDEYQRQLQESKKAYEAGLATRSQEAGRSREDEARERRQREQERASPPRPLTAQWLGRHGSLGGQPAAVREQALPPAEDDGMASVCGQLWVTPPGGGGETAYIVKRSRGAMHDDHLAPMEREWRFYAEVVPREAAPLAEAMRVPRCIAANLLPRGSCWAGQRAASFVLVLERFCSPIWTRWDPDVGCSDAQAVASVEALARLHALFAEDGRLAPLSWVPAVASGQADFTGTWQRAAASCRGLLGPAALELGQRLSVGGLARASAMVSRPPLTLLHGDFKPENLRFSSAAGQGPQVAAFDWGNVARGRGAYDFAYFSALSGPPARRRARDGTLLERYSEAYRRASRHGSGPPGGFQDDVKAAACMIFCNHVGCVMSPHFQAANMQRMLRRSLQWLGEAISDWRVGTVLQ